MEPTTSSFDQLTGVYNRSGMLSMLFRETDRVQRMGTPLCLLVFELDDFGRVVPGARDDLLRETARRVSRLLRSYDVLGRIGDERFLAILPGCKTAEATRLAERLRRDAFTTPFRVAGEAIRLSACFATATSDGRSPVVVLREAEFGLQEARASVNRP
jgi:diguanylate cyclase (GGDEF)-like protein